MGLEKTRIALFIEALKSWNSFRWKCKTLLCQYRKRSKWQHFCFNKPTHYVSEC